MCPRTAGPAPDDDRRVRLERVLALTRLSLGLLAMIVVQIDPPGGLELGAANALIRLYIGYACLAAVSVVVPAVALRPLGAALQALDVVWALIISGATEGPADTFFVFFVFVAVGAAYRWGLRETLATGVITAVLLIVDALVALPGPLRGGHAPPLSHLVSRCGFAIALAWLIGYLAQEQKRARQEAASVGRIVATLNAGLGLRAVMQRLLEELLAAFEARRAVLVFHEQTSGNLYAWELSRVGGAVQPVAVAASDRERWNFPWPAVSPVCLVSGPPPAVHVSGAAGRPLPDEAKERLREHLAEARHVLIGSTGIGGEWTGRLFLYDSASAHRETTRKWLAGLLPQLAPGLYSQYLLGRLRSKATAMERSRIARELHDGIIQSLVGLEMHVGALRRRPGAQDDSVAADLADIQGKLHSEAMNARELMQQIRPVEADAGDLPGQLASVAERFRRDTGIDTRFQCELNDVRIAPRLARELVRIAQEALVNIRKHSRARHVVLRFAMTETHWALTVDDDGDGFDFGGRHSLEDLDTARRGPLVIKERVRVIGGMLTLDSSPGRGSRLEVAVPRSTR
jgi:signal transduction histidine kinase